MFQPLEGVRILDLSRLAPGPYGTLLLGDLGAEVIKVEEPTRGDYARSLSLSDDEESEDINAYFQALNRNKKSVTLNLKTERARELFYQLVEGADAVVESFRPGVVDKLKVDYDTLKDYNQDLVYCSLTGYGQTGPYKDLSGHDINYLAVSGILGLTGEKDGPPRVPGVPLADLVAGTFLTVSVLAALQGEGGQYVDVSMTDVTTTWTMPYIQELFAGGEAPARGETRHQKHPSYAVYRTRDDEYVAIGAMEQKFWTNLCEAVDLPQYIDHSHPSDPELRQQIKRDLQEVFETRTRSEWVDYLLEHDVPVSPVNNLDELEQDPHLSSRDLIADREPFGKQFRFPVRFSDSIDEFRTPAPELGQHTDELLQDLGLDEATVRELDEQGVV